MYPGFFTPDPLTFEHRCRNMTSLYKLFDQSVHVHVLFHKGSGFGHKSHTIIDKACLEFDPNVFYSRGYIFFRNVRVLELGDVAV